VADRGTATLVPTSAFNVATDYDPIIRGSGETFEPKRYLCVEPGVWVPIQ
jgi:hypothetical protein